MKIIISPAMKMKVNQDTFPVQSQPVFLEKTKILEEFLKNRSYDELKKIWHASDRVIRESQQQLEVMNLTKGLTPAVLSFSGIQYQYMMPDLFTKPALTYLQKNFWILSGFYGALRPFDGVCPYRLEMKNKLMGFTDPSLYKFWGSSIADLLFKDDNVIINLASKEYSKVVAPYLNGKRQMIAIDFQEKKNGTWKTVGVHAKMARGEMSKFIAEKQLTRPEELQDFHDFGFQFEPKISTADHFIFRTKFDFKRH
ncbi:peroxide stress protein YaaA [Lactobacillus sp. ESL0791]|uniref:peroxide stress protein YaaA n=1 Tax=Lactobacillus sp. ESL0791 TaxID=2983234 RepID=UPI0023FA2298|nr:peroxide stress protein YaaA [Lactobacillus sp. ESL0791]MDF7638124.1 peroxide stress protein YaaA [Lactobacillus sp. ESL0791]